MVSLAHDNSTNDFRFSDLVAEVETLGAEAAAGKDSLPKMALKLVKASADGVIDTQPDKHGPGIDDAAKLYAGYASAMSRKAIHDHTDNGLKSNTSKARKLIEMGGMTTCDPVDVMNRAALKYREKAGGPVKLKPAYAAYVDVARAQLRQEAPLTDEQIEEICAKPDARDKTLEAILKPIEKTLGKIISGERTDGVKDQSEQIITAYEAIKERLSALMLVSKRKELRAIADKHGLDISIMSISAIRPAEDAGDWQQPRAAA